MAASFEVECFKLVEMVDDTCLDANDDSYGSWEALPGGTVSPSLVPESAVLQVFRLGCCFRVGFVGALGWRVLES